MPPDVRERDYLSVLLGNYTHAGVGVGAGTRWWPELLEPQPNTHLIYHLVMVTGSPKSSFDFTNLKLKNIKRAVGVNSPSRIKPIWLEQGEEIGKFFCGGGEGNRRINGGGSMTIFLCNRPMDFTSDIKYFSKMELKGSNHKSFDCLIRTRDIVGVLL